MRHPSRRQFLLGSMLGAGLSGAALEPGLSLAQQLRSPKVVSPEDFGGGIGGNDTLAFQKCARLLQRGGGTLRLSPGKTYTVGLQDAFRKGRAYIPQDIFAVRGCANPIVVDGRRAKIKVADGLFLGAFDPKTGKRHHTDLPFTNWNYRVEIGNVLYFEQCANVQIHDLEIDGNNTKAVLGGLWGDKGRQCVANNITCLDCLAVTISNVHSHHAALDNLYVRDSTVGPLAVARPVHLSNVVLEHAARQGLSWTGGKGLSAINCKFNHTGRAINESSGERFSTEPGAGLDIEASAGALCRDGHFVNCEFVNNVGAGMVADTGDSADCLFDGCVFWGTTSRAIWPKKPRFRFHNCRIYGSVVALYSPLDAESGIAHPDAPHFQQCEFEDRAYLDGRVHRDSGVRLLHFASKGGWLMDGCRISVNAQQLGIIPRGVLRNTTITWMSSDRPNRDAIIKNEGSTWEDVIVDDRSNNTTKDGYFIDEGSGATYRNCALNSPSGKLKWVTWSASGGGFTGPR